jgi:hypothetical protein
MPKPVWDDFSRSYREHVLDKKEVRNRCLVCGKVVDFPRKCSYCKGIYCDEHGLPELHNCKSLPARGWAAYKALKMGEKTTLPQDNIVPNYKRPNLFGKPIEDNHVTSVEPPGRNQVDEGEEVVNPYSESHKVPPAKPIINGNNRFSQEDYDQTLHNEGLRNKIKIFMVIFLIFIIGIIAFSFIRLSSSQVIVVDKLQVSPSKAISGDSIVASVSFKNYIDDQGDPIVLFINGIEPLQNFIKDYILKNQKEFDIKVDGELLIKKIIILGVDKTYNYTFLVLVNDPGRHIVSVNNTSCEFLILNQSRFDGSYFKIQPDSPSIGEDIIVSVNVINVGAIVDTKTIQLYVNNVKIKESQLNLSPNQYRTLELTISEEKAGSYNITLGGLSDKFVRIIQVTNAINAITGKYKNYYLGLVKSPSGVLANSYGDFTVLINNKNAKDPTYSQLLTFLKSDKTDQYPYQYVITILNSYTGSAESHVDLDTIKEIIDGTKQPSPPRICADFAEMFHNNAEKVGIRCAFVSIEVSGSGHALNAFNTIDRGIVYIDDTGILSGYGPSNCDKIIDLLRVGDSYIPRSLFPEPGWSSTWENAGTVTSIYMTWDGNWNK